jgi:hypothetical protein
VAGTKIFCSTNPPVLLWSVLFNAYLGSFSGVKRPNPESYHSPPVSNLRMSGVIPLLLYAFMALAGDISHFSTVVIFTLYKMAVRIVEFLVNNVSVEVK